jgi:hypothetical protein
MTIEAQLVDVAVSAHVVRPDFLDGAAGVAAQRPNAINDFPDSSNRTRIMQPLAALTAAFSLATYRLVKWGARPARVLSAIDTRKALNMDYDLSFSVLFPAFYDLSNGIHFWDLARKITQDIAPFKSVEVIAGVFGAFKSIMSDATVESIAAFENRECSSDVVVSNLGVLPFQTDYGTLILEELWGPSILFGTEGEHMIGAATLNNSIHLLYTSFASYPSLLETGEQILLSSLECDE